MKTMPEVNVDNAGTEFHNLSAGFSTSVWIVCSSIFYLMINGAEWIFEVLFFGEFCNTFITNARCQISQQLHSVG